MSAVASRSAAAALLLLAVPTVAGAQSVDYGTYEQLFGEPVTSSATGQPQRTRDVPANMTIVTQADIERSGAQTIPDVLRFLAGIDVRSYGIADQAVGIRGGNTALNPRVLVLLDGRQVFQDDYGLTVWPLIPVALNDIRQIEIIKGPNSALYGFNAVSGVINIITFDALSDRVRSVRIDGGTQDELRGEAAASARVAPAVGMRLSATAQRSDDYRSGPAVDANDGTRIGTLAVDMRAQLSSRIDLLLSGSIGSVGMPTFVDFGTYSPTIAFQANSLRAKMSADSAFGLLSLDYYRNENRVNERNPLYQDDWRQDVSVLRAGDTMILGRSNIVRVGLEYRNNAVASGTAFNGRVGFNNYAASLMWNWQITGSIALTNAVRVDRLDLSHEGAAFYTPVTNGDLYRDEHLTEPSFNTGLVYKLDNLDTLRLLAARAIQLPSLFDFGYARSADNAFFLQGSPSLKPAHVWNAELDWDRTLPFLRADLHAAAFIQYTDRTIGSPFGSAPAILPTGQFVLAAQNYGGSRETGGELTLKGQAPDGVRWTVNYALALVHDETGAGVLDHAPSVAYENQTPTSTIDLGLGRTFGRFDLDAQARWQSRFLDYRSDGAELVAQPYVVPNYLTVDARLGFHVARGVTAALTAEQLNRATLVQSSGVLIERRVFATLSLRL